MYKNINLQFLISYLGLLPYLIVIIDKFLLQQIEIKILESFTVYYSIIILVFIGSINWNLEEKVSKKKVLYGFLPSCVSVFIIIIYLYNFDVFILLISFQYTERYSQLIRNTGFIISTILLRLSFSASGLTSILLIISGILFGLLILLIYNAMERERAKG